MKNPPYTLLTIVAVLIFCALLSACSRVSTSSQPSRGSIIPGTLRYASNGIFSLNPLNQSNTNEVLLDMYLYGWFFEADDKGRFVPDLALQVPTYENGGISRDGRTLTYHLRRGVVWHDGAPFTAHDVVFTVHAIMNPRNNVFSRTGWDDIESIETPDDYTVGFHLKQPYAPAIATFFMAYQHSGYPVLPAHLLERYSDLNRVPFNGAPVGTGPFKLREWVRGDRLVFEANEHYWRGPPKLKRIIVRIIQDDNTILTEFRTHELDAVFSAPAALYPQLRAIPEAVVTLSPSAEYELVVLNTRHTPLDDVRVRRAIDYAIDKQRIIANVTHGVGLPADSDIVATSWAHAPSLPGYRYDPVKARALLEQSGWTLGPDGVRVKDGKRLTLILTSIAKDSTRTASEQLVQAALHDVGIEGDVKNYPAEMIYATEADGGVLAGGRYDLEVVGQNTGIDPDDSTLYMCDQIPPAGVNDAFWCDQTFDAAERGALSNYDQAARKRYYAITQGELAAQVPVVFLYYGQVITATSPRLHGLRLTPSEIFNWNSWEWSLE